MKQVIIIHGLPSKEEFYDSRYPSPSNSHWIPWIQKQLNKQNILSQALEMPEPYFPDYQKWSEVFSQMKISNETILVGHSCGAGFLVRYLSEHLKVTPKKVILVAPWIDPGNDNYLRSQGNNFFDFSMDKNLAKRSEVHIIFSTDDEKYILESVEEIKSEISGIHYHEFTNKGHFTEPDLGSKEFPELVELILK